MPACQNLLLRKSLPKYSLFHFTKQEQQEQEQKIIDVPISIKKYTPIKIK